MRILILSDDFPPKSFGGAGRIALNLACDLQKLGHQIFVITTVRDKLDEGNIDYQGLKIFKIYSKYHQRWRIYFNLYNPQTVGKVKELLKKIKPDIVHAHNIHYYLSYYCLKLAKEYSKAVFLTCHDVMPVYYGKWVPKYAKDYKITLFDQIQTAQKRYNPFGNILVRYFLGYVDKIFAVSNALKEFLEVNGIKNVETIYNGIKISDWPKDSKEISNFVKKHNLFGKKIILFGGRISYLKGGLHIIRAMKKIIQEIPQAYLMVMGERKRCEGMIKLAKELGVRNHIIFTGWISGNELKSAYHNCHIVAVPSIYLDPFPTVNLEAMACKKPVVGTCFGGTPEVVQDGATGYIVNPFNIGIVAEKIIDLLKNSQKAKQFGEAGCEMVKTGFNLEQQVRKTAFWYQKMNV